MNTLVIFRDVDEYYFGHLNIPNVQVVGVFKKRNFWYTNFVKIKKKMCIGGIERYYDNWYDHLEKYDRIIVFDSAYLLDHSLLNNISKSSNVADKFFYSWNTVLDESAFFDQQKAATQAGFKMYNFDPRSCKKYGLSFNTIMYDELLSLPSRQQKYDAVFLGFLKSRGEMIKSVYRQFSDAGVLSHFVIIGSKANDTRFDFRSKYVNYYEYLSMISESKSIVDIVQDGQRGYSMRVMEAIFFNKKLITNNSTLLEADFYSPNNILVLKDNEDNTELIKDFFQLPFINYATVYRKYYSFYEWTRRFKK